MCRRKSLDEDAAAAALGFGKKRSLEKSRGMMQMFVRRATQKTQSVSPVCGEKKIEKGESTGVSQVSACIAPAMLRVQQGIHTTALLQCRYYYTCAEC